MKSPILLFTALALAHAAPLLSQSDSFLIGLRQTVVTADGEPANDMISAGIALRYRLSERCLIGAAIDKAEFDFEGPASIVGIEQDSTVETIDSTVESIIYSVWAERELGSSERFRWFVSIGAGFASPEVEDVSGPIQGGGTFDLTTDAGSEFIANAAGGFRFNFARHLGFEFALRGDHHFSEWEVRDRLSGARGTTGDYTAFGGHVGLNLRF